MGKHVSDQTAPLSRHIMVRVAYPHLPFSRMLNQMVKVYIKACVSAAVAIFIVASLGHRFGLVPPLGKFLNPFDGSWRRHAGQFESGHGTLLLKGLNERVQVVVDTDQIKHVFAANDHDLYFAQGYILASERLWQMESLVRTGSGRLAEVMGAGALEFDIYVMRLGLPAAAEASATAMLADPISGPAIRAYADGVNAYVTELTNETLPFEYKFLGIRPEPWSPRSAAYLVKLMAWSLAGGSTEMQLSRSAQVVGRAGFESLFPLDNKIPEPIIPPGAHQTVRSIVPEAPSPLFEPTNEALQPMPTPNPANGSNNWAVDGKKSVTGYPILSNDIHLSLTLPSLWYEMQLVSPTQNVYGIAMPGAPGIILGFNSSIAWGATNGGDDVMDWFQLRYRDEKRNEYLYDGVWHPVISYEKRIKVRDQEPHLLTLRETHFGPIVYDKGETPIKPTVGRDLALRWLVLSESNELKNFLRMNHASGIDSFRRALDGYTTPAMNFLCADNKGQIALWQTGRLPLRWPGQGRLIGDGSNSRYDWKGFLTVDEAPTVKNPPRGFISSANQAPFETGQSPFYLGWPFELPYRAMRINELLKSKTKFAPQDFIRMQRDTLAVSTRQLIPILQSSLAGVELKAQETKVLAELSHWDFTFEEDSAAAPLAYAWMKETESGLWSRLFPDRRSFLYPSLTKTIEILSDPSSRWYDNPATEKIETRAELVHASLERAILEVTEKTGTSDPKRWTWATYRPTHFDHISRIPGLGRDDLPASGMEHTIFANGGSHGPVWKQVVALNPQKPRAWGVYPGGQSGDPLSPHYDDFLDAWRKGEMKELQFMLTPNDVNTRRIGTVDLMRSGP